MSRIVLPWIVVAATLAIGCGASSVGVQADLIAMGGIASAGADRVLVDARSRALDRVVVDAAAECGDEGCTDERAEHWRDRLAEIEGQWAPALACRAPVVESLRAWADGLETAIATETDELGLELLLRLARRFLAAWASLERCIETAAPGVDLPGLPRELVMLGGGS